MRDKLSPKTPFSSTRHHCWGTGGSRKGRCEMLNTWKSSSRGEEVPGVGAGQESSLGMTCYAPSSQTDRLPSVPPPSPSTISTAFGAGRDWGAFVKQLEKTAMWGREGGGLPGRELPNLPAPPKWANIFLKCSVQNRAPASGRDQCGSKFWEQMGQVSHLLGNRAK